MQKASGHGIMFCRIDGHVVEYELEAGADCCRHWTFGRDDSKLYDGDQKCSGCKEYVVWWRKECLTQYLQALGKYGCKQCQSVM